MRTVSHTPVGTHRRRWVWFFAALAAGCGGGDNPLGSSPSREQVAVEMAQVIPAATTFEWECIDFSDARSVAAGIAAGGATFSEGPNGGFSVRRDASGADESPADGTTLGSPAHLLLRGEGEVHFIAPLRLVGLHLSLTRAQVTALQGLTPESAGGYTMHLPELRVLVSGLDETGNVISTLRAIPAAATFARSRVETGWRWLDATLLGEVHGLRLSVESPLSGYAFILFDNLTTSTQYRADPDYFTIGLLPDTQKYAELSELNDGFHAQTRYLSEQRDAERIVFVSHLGDIVEKGGDEREWEVADEAMARLDGVVPYGIVVGNHDFVDWKRPALGAPLFHRYFPASRHAGQPWFGGRSPDDLSSFQLFGTPLGPFLYLHLSVDSPPPTLAWADSVVAAHPGVLTAVTTHVYLRENGRLPAPYMSGMATGPWNGISAQVLFRTFIARHDQIFLVTCGHISAECLQISSNDTGKPVIEMLADYQNRDLGGEGFLRLLRFYPARDQLLVLTYSPWLTTWEMDQDSFFFIPMVFPQRLHPPA